MERNQNTRHRKKMAAGILLAAAVLFSFCFGIWQSRAQAAGTAIKYQNEIFTKQLYQNTVKIGFAEAKSTAVSDKPAVKKAYALLAKMKLQKCKRLPDTKKDSVIRVIIYQKNGKKQTYQISGNNIRCGSKAYTIVKNNPSAGLRSIFCSVWDSNSDSNKNQEKFAVVAADYPKMAKYPKEEDYIGKDGSVDMDAYYRAYDRWAEDAMARRSQTVDTDGLDGFLINSTKQFLSGEPQENRIYSPLNVYMALGMLAELTDGNSQKQILDLLGSKDIQSLRKQASGLWKNNYCDDGAVTSILASSLWLNQNINFVQPTMDSLAKNYYASAYRGQMGSAEFNKALQDWLNEQTGGLLKDQASNVELEPATILALATTVYYRAKWHEEFLEAQTKKETFHAVTGDIDCDFMHKEKSCMNYYWGDKFAAAAQKLEGSGSMWFLLPDEGVAAEELLKDSQAMEFLTSKDRDSWENQKWLPVNLSVPKFDVSSNIDLRDGLKALGVWDVFDMKLSDFSPMTTDVDEIFLSKAEHAGRAAIDEKGVVAAAYTVMAMDAGAALPPDEEVDFVLDRPFLFAITGSDGLPLFVGVVNQP